MTMVNTLPRSTHSDRLERYLGAEAVAQLSAAMCNPQAKWYGRPIAVAGVPGLVYADRDGDFIGAIEAGHSVSAIERAHEIAKRERRRQMARMARRTRQLGAITSYDGALAAYFGGGNRLFNFNKAGTTGVVAATNTLWFVGSQPSAGAAAGAAPGGTVPTDATAGAFPFDNPSSGTQHFLFGRPIATVSANTLLLYDRIFSVTKTMSSTTTEAVTGVPTRYQSTTQGAADSAENNFLMIECRTALGATAHNWTTCLYTDQSGNTGATLPSVTGNSSNIVNRLDQPTGTWFAPLAAGDTGIRNLTQMQCSASVTGAIDFTIGHPIAWMPCPLANFVAEADGLTTSIQLERIFDDACLAFLELCKPATTATTYTGNFTTIRG